MNSIILSGKIISSPIQVCDFKQCKNKFFSLLTDWGQIIVGIDNNLTGGINIGEDILVKGKLSRLVTSSNPLTKYKSNDFVYVDANVVKSANRADLNELTLDCIIERQTCISGKETLLTLSTTLNSINTKLYCGSNKPDTYLKKVRVIGKLVPSTLDNSGNIEYIISATKILDKINEDNWGK